MARYGFSGEKLDMKKLILFVMTTLPPAVEEETLRELTLLDDNANYFVFVEALQELEEGGQLSRGEENLLMLSEQGAKVADIVKNDVAASLRRSVAKAAAAVTEKMRRDSLVYTDTVRIGGETYFEAALSDGQTELVFLRLLLGNEDQARLLTKGFYKKAEKIYEAVWAAILDS